MDNKQFRKDLFALVDSFLAATSKRADRGHTVLDDPTLPPITVYGFEMANAVGTLTEALGHVIGVTARDAAHAERGAKLFAGQLVEITSERYEAGQKYLRSMN